MLNEKKTKWDIGSAISAANSTLALAIKHKDEIERRLQPDELAQFKANINELDLHRSGQTENLVQQKSKTLKQDEVINKLHDAVMSIRNIVKNSSSASTDIVKAYGVGEKVNFTVSHVAAAGNIIISAYKNFTSWSNNVGIIEADITEISEMMANLSMVEEVQDSSMLIRKSKTMDKNQLQRTVEDEVSKISALGQHIFRSKNAAVARLFEDLIPSTAKGKAEPDTTTESKAKA